MADNFLIHTLRTAHKSLVGVCSHTGMLQASPDIIPIVLIRHSSRPDLGFLMGTTDSPVLSCENDKDLRRPLLSYRVVPAKNDKIALRNPLWEHYISAPPTQHNKPMICDRPYVAEWESFILEEAPSDLILPLKLREAIQEVVSEGMNAISLKKWCLSSDSIDMNKWLVAFLRLLTRDGMEHFGKSLLENSVLRERVRLAVPDDYWINTALPELANWKEDRRPIKSFRFSVTTDFLGRIDYGERTAPPLGLALTGQTRRLIEPNKRACILATARDEGIYLLEWVAWHRMIGFDHIFICSNNNTDGSNDLLSALSHHGFITWIDTNPQSYTRIQRKAYAIAGSIIPQILDYRWTLVIDLDEMLAIDHNYYKNVSTFFDLQEARGADAVTFSWAMMAPDSQLRHHDAPMAARFLRREPPKNELVKTAFQTRLAPFAHAHNPHWAWQRSFRTLDASGSLLHTEKSGIQAHGRKSENNAWIAHYFHKSVEEFVWKCSRPRGGSGDPRSARQFTARFVDVFTEFFDEENTLPDRRLEPFMPALEEEMRRLRLIPDIRIADENVRKNFRDEISDLMEQAHESVMNSHYDDVVKEKWNDIILKYKTD
ncbi:glycosyltransferase family 2 protein [Gluconobacter japonicus]|uniref:glycosyltransferase family 2 protein n=1 Tax=Gluconobacter japonicus TaxID=376620 RepID=UPI0024ADDC81|nr:glycosyltransferase family 2 protein [Gluconobacter japonicus]MDI6652276.1 glycosyltransferase family 2 protein [Gluconobacter japonicus]